MPARWKQGALQRQRRWGWAHGVRQNNLQRGGSPQMGEQHHEGSAVIAQFGSARASAQSCGSRHPGTCRGLQSTLPNRPRRLNVASNLHLAVGLVGRDSEIGIAVFRVQRQKLLLALLEDLAKPRHRFLALAPQRVAPGKDHGDVPLLTLQFVRHCSVVQVLNVGIWDADPLHSAYVPCPHATRAVAVARRSVADRADQLRRLENLLHIGAVADPQRLLLGELANSALVHVGDPRGVVGGFLRLEVGVVSRELHLVRGVRRAKHLLQRHAYLELSRSRFKCLLDVVGNPTRRPLGLLPLPVGLHCVLHAYEGHLELPMKKGADLVDLARATPSSVCKRLLVGPVGIPEPARLRQMKPSS
mmetsp:Transcript_8272/g.19832  ORF Transcript_8272/g.19832 Transcript_8272/m.19832 type:complete len:359 (+) Transcript_8272:1506-2582(+)